MTTEFAGKVFLVTGAARGQGAAEAQLLAERGASVLLTDVLDDAGQTLAQSMKERGASAIYLPLDVASEEGWYRVAKEVETRFGRLDGLINNAGIPLRGKTLAETSLADWHKLLEVNLTGAFLGTRTAAPMIARSGGGAIVNIGSAAGMTGHFAAAYSATKWAMRGLTKSAAMEFASENVRVNCVHPGLVTTPIVDESEGFVAAMTAMTPLSRAGGVDEIAQVVAFLLSEAASYITGIDVPVDGGLTDLGTYRAVQARVHESGKPI